MEKEFAKFGPLEKVQVVLDGKVKFIKKSEELNISLQITHKDSLLALWYVCFYGNSETMKIIQAEIITQKSIDHDKILNIKNTYKSSQK